MPEKPAHGKTGPFNNTHGQLGQRGYVVSGNLFLLGKGFLCVSSASRLPRSVGLLGATASLPLCAVVVGFIPFVCKKPWLFFLSSCFLSMITEYNTLQNFNKLKI